MKDIKSLIPALKDRAVFVGWLAAIFLVAGLCWFFTGPLRAELLLRSVNDNRLLSSLGEERPFLERPIPAGELPPNAARMGSWFSVMGRENSRALVFTFFSGASFFPCLAMVNPEGKVEEILPLSLHAEAMLSGTPEGVMRLHIRRIEGGQF